MEQGWRKGPWTPEEDKLLSDYVELHGEGRWISVAIGSGLNRNGKSCRLRWVNYLRPGLKRGHLTPQEEAIIIELHALWGNRWSTIARYLPGRTDNEIKNYWRTHFKKPELEKPQKQPKRKGQNNNIVAPKLGDNKTLSAPAASKEEKSDDEQMMMMNSCGTEGSAEVFTHDPAAAMAAEDFSSWAAAAAAAAEDALWSSLWGDAAESDHVAGEDLNIFCNGGFLF